MDGMEGSSLFWKDNAWMQKVVQEWSEEHTNKSKLNSPVQYIEYVGSHQIFGDPNLQDLQDLLLMSWCQMQDTFGDLVESISQQVKSALAANWGPIQY